VFRAKIIVTNGVQLSFVLAVDKLIWLNCKDFGKEYAFFVIGMASSTSQNLPASAIGSNQRIRNSNMLHETTLVNNLGVIFNVGQLRCHGNAAVV
jgi:hypothetical protein